MVQSETRDSECRHLTKHGDSALENFWAKVSKASYSRDLAKAEKLKLLKENFRLQAFLREYCVREKVEQNLCILGFGKGSALVGKGPKTGVVAQDGSIIPQIKKPLLKVKYEQKLK